MHNAENCAHHRTVRARNELSRGAFGRKAPAARVVSSTKPAFQARQFRMPPRGIASTTSHFSLWMGNDCASPAPGTGSAPTTYWIVREQVIDQ